MEPPPTYEDANGEVKEEKKPDPIYIPPTGVNSPQPVRYIGRSQRPVHRNQTNDSSFCDVFTCYFCLDSCSDCCHACTCALCLNCCESDNCCDCSGCDCSGCDCGGCVC